MVQISGASELVDHFERTLQKLTSLVGGRMEDAMAFGRQSLWPIFVMSSRRPTTACLNWAAPHVLKGAYQSSLVVTVINPDEVEDYRCCWASNLMLELPEGGHRLGYARNVVKRTFEWRTPFFWAVDDNLVAFEEIRRTHSGERGATFKNGPLFLRAFAYAQQQQLLPHSALVGFLATNGTQSLKKKTHIVDSMRFAKCFLLN